jgi:hypothetical protein
MCSAGHIGGAVQITQNDNGWSSAQLTLILYGWDGKGTRFSNLVYCLPHTRAPRVTFVDKSTRLVSRAASFLTPTPRGTGVHGSPSQAGSLGRKSYRGAGDSSTFDDAVSTGSAKSMTARRASLHRNKLQ